MTTQTERGDTSVIVFEGSWQPHQHQHQHQHQHLSQTLQEGIYAMENNSENCNACCNPLEKGTTPSSRTVSTFASSSSSLFGNFEFDPPFDPPAFNAGHTTAREEISQSQSQPPCDPAEPPRRRTFPRMLQQKKKLPHADDDHNNIFTSSLWASSRRFSAFRDDSFYGLGTGSTLDFGTSFRSSSICDWMTGDDNNNNSISNSSPASVSNVRNNITPTQVTKEKLATDETFRLFDFDAVFPPFVTKPHKIDKDDKARNTDKKKRSSEKKLKGDGEMSSNIGAITSPNELVDILDESLKMTRDFRKFLEMTAAAKLSTRNLAVVETEQPAKPLLRRNTLDKNEKQPEKKVKVNPKVKRTNSVGKADEGTRNFLVMLETVNYNRITKGRKQDDTTASSTAQVESQDVNETSSTTLQRTDSNSSKHKRLGRRGTR